MRLTLAMSPNLLCSNVNDNQLTGNMPESWSIGPAFKVLADLQVRALRALRALRVCFGG